MDAEVNNQRLHALKKDAYNTVKRVHIIGRKNHGKTTLVVELVKALREMNLAVGTIKHTHHHHEFDTPGKDSFRHREAGAQAVGICSPEMNAVFWPMDRSSTRPEDQDDTQESKYAQFDALFADCDIVLVEGDSETRAIKLEVWRSEVSTDPISLHDHSVHAIITDDQVPDDVNAITQKRTWKRSDVAYIAEQLAALL